MQMKEFIKARKEHPDIFDAAMLHDLQNDIYLVARKDKNSGNTLLLAYNSSGKTQDANFATIIKDRFNDFTTIKKPLTGNMKIDLEKSTLVLPGNESMMIILK